jgi:hypothetical protein
MQLVHDRVAAAACDQPAVDRERGDEGDQERDAQAPPEKRIVEPCCDGAGDDEDERVVDDLSIVVIESVSEANVSPTARRKGTFARRTGPSVSE